MTVYVDGAENALGRMKMCHMVAPDVDELHTLAFRIGMRRQWFQDPKTMPRVSAPHYDVAKGRRALAITLGAVEIDKYQMSVISKIAMNRHYGHDDAFLDPLRIFRQKGGEFPRPASPRLPDLEAWLAAQLGDGVVERARQNAVKVG